MRTVFQSGAAAVFWGSFLLFVIQPMLGRTLLPVFGGSSAVWCVCLAAYQTLLLAGYAYAAGVARRGRAVRRLHVCVAVAAACWALAVALGRFPLLAWLGDGTAQTGAVLLGVLLFVGIPYGVLSAGSTLVQAWRTDDDRSGRSVYSLYAVSNVGSLLGLLAYPFALEPFVPLTVQWYGFAAGLFVYAALLARLAAAKPSANDGTARADGAPVASPSPVDASACCAWFLLPAASTFLLNAVIAHLMVDVTPMPLVWVVPLAAFLLSYAAAFAAWGERRPGLWCAAAAVALAGAAVVRGWWGMGSFFPNASADVAVLFFAGTVVHAWLYAARPAADRLTRYYLLIAAGGAAGGLLAALVAPLVFNGTTEYSLALLVCAAVVAWRTPKPAAVCRTRWGNAGFAAVCCLLWLVLAQATARHSFANTIYRGRNFYGCLAVTQTLERQADGGICPVHYLWCGQTTHGIQLHTSDVTLRRLPTAYYGPLGGGIALTAHPKCASGDGMKVGVVGLGAGTLACYGRPGDLYRFYEINPQVVQVATDPKLFTYLPDARMPIDLVPGDARRMLEKERAAHDPLYDVLVIDAYSGDAVPYHLATREAFQVYFDRLADDGILAVHVSNWHIDLLPLCKAMAEELDVCAYGVVSGGQADLVSGAIWVFMTRHPMVYRYPGKERVSEVDWRTVRSIPAPTDEKGSLVTLMRW